MNKKAKVLASSVAAIALSSSLIAGSTYALFTSESSVNIAVTSGKVQVTAQIGEIKTTSLGVKQTVVKDDEGNLVQANFANGGFASVDGNVVTVSGISAGDKVEIPVSVANASTINVLYNTEVNVKGALAEELEVSVVGEGTYAGVLSYTSNWNLLEKDAQTDATTTITVELPESSNAQGLGADIELVVNAIQANGAEAGTGKHVKTVNATYVTTDAELKNAIANGEDIILEGDVDLSGAEVSYTKDATLNLNGKTLTAKGRTPDTGWGVISAKGDTTLVIDGDGTVNSLGMQHPIAVESFDGATIIVNSGTFIAGDEYSSLYVNGKTVDTWVIVNGGYFKTGLYRGDHCVINIRDNKLSHALVCGGTFENYNPAWGDQTMNKDIYGKDYDDEGNFRATGGFVAEGYKVELEEKEDGTKLYTVVEIEKEVIEVADATELKEAVKKDNVIIKLAANTEYDVSGLGEVTSNNIVLQGAAGTVLNCGTAEVQGAAGLYFSGDRVTVSDLTIISASTNSDVAALKLSNIAKPGNYTLKNLTVYGGAGNGVGIHGVNNVVVDGVHVVTHKKCGFAVAAVRDVVTFTNCTVDVDTGWKYDIGCMAKNDAKEYPYASNIVLGEGNNFKNGIIYGEYGKYFDGEDTVNEYEGWTYVPGENGGWVLVRNDVLASLGNN